MSTTSKETVPTAKMHNTNKKPTRKPPVVKQTLTSIYRTLKANPLLLSNDSKYNQCRDFDVSTIKIPNTMKPVNSWREESNSNKAIKQPLLLPYKSFRRKDSTTVKEKSILKKSSNTSAANKMLPPKLNTQPNYYKSTTTSVSQKKGNNLVKAASTTRTTKPIIIKRRSISAEHFERVKSKNLNVKTKTETILPDVSPIVERNVHRVTFKASPPTQRKRSLSCSATPSRKSIYINMASTPKPAPSDLHQRLEQWLQQKKKPIQNYHHLKCFGFKNLKPKIDDYDDENKENIEINCASTSSSYENLNISNSVPKIQTVVDTPITYSCRSTGNDVEVRYLAQGALTDLHALIMDGYSSEQCEAWLGMIRQKFNGLEEEPQYWECRAAIEQTRGNITSAVDCLRSAIVHGAEVNKVDNCLEQLLQKFSLLNISESERTKTTDPSKKDRTRILCDARNIFKSTIIQFAIQERTFKKKPLQETITEKKQFVATPVRRSTRRRTMHVSTPGLKLCSTLQELEPNIRDRLSFEKNSALSVQ